MLTSADRVEPLTARGLDMRSSDCRMRLAVALVTPQGWAPAGLALICLLTGVWETHMNPYRIFLIRLCQVFRKTLQSVEFTLNTFKWMYSKLRSARRWLTAHHSLTPVKWSARHQLAFYLQYERFLMSRYWPDKVCSAVNEPSWQLRRLHT